MSRRNREDQEPFGIQSSVELMTVEIAARALGFLARWAARRLERRIVAQTGMIAPITSDTSNGYGAQNGQN